MEEKNQAEQMNETENPELVPIEEEAAETAEAAEMGQPEDDAEKFRKQAEENYNRFLRVQADFDNFRKRSRKEKEDMMKYASQSVIEALLPAVDNLERALTAGQGTEHVESLMKGVEMVFRQIQQVLEQEGLEPIEAEGKPFDPHYHQAVMQEESPEHDSGIVIQELQKGYMLKDKVIRPSMVKVSQ